MEIKRGDFDELVKFLSIENIEGYSYQGPISGGKAATALLYKKNNKEKILLKLLACPRSEEELKAFTDEANILETVTDKRPYPYVPKYKIKLKKIEKLPVFYFGMEYIEGKTLYDYISEYPLPWDWKKSLSFLARISLSVGNSLPGIVHRDIHPKNIIVTNYFSLHNNDFYCKESGIRILDLGCHKDEIKALWSEWKERDKFRLFGARSSWSPEFVASPDSVDCKHDIWALGVLFYRFLTGEYPTKCENMRELIDLYSSDSLGLDYSKFGIPYPVITLSRNLLSLDPKNRLYNSEIVKMVNDLINNDLAKMSKEFIDEYINFNGQFYCCCVCGFYSKGRGSRCGQCGKVIDNENGFVVQNFMNLAEETDKIKLVF